MKLFALFAVVEAAYAVLRPVNHERAAKKRASGTAPNRSFFQALNFPLAKSTEVQS